MYFSLTSDLLIFSHGVGHSLVNVDCTIRAKKLGANWTLYIDNDEFLVAGKDHPVGAEFSGVCRLHGQGRALIFRSVALVEKI